MNDLQEALKSEAGRLLKEFLLKHYYRLNTLEDVKDLKNSADQALEVKSKLKALKVLKGILLEILDAESFEKRELKDEDKLFYEE